MHAYMTQKLLIIMRKETKNNKKKASKAHAAKTAKLKKGQWAGYLSSLSLESVIRKKD